MIRTYLIVLLVGIALLSPRSAEAIPPPDFLFQIGSQMGQIFSLLAVALAAGVAAVGGMFRHVLMRFRRPRLLIGVAGIVVVGAALGVSLLIEKARSDAFRSQFDREIEQILEKEIAKHDEVPADPTRQVDTALTLEVTNEEFDALDNTDIFALDAREDEEYDLGHYTDSYHIRFADILAGAWTALPTDEVVYVMCWSGIRGSEVAEFLRSKGVTARYLEDGADGWVKYGGAWDGEIAFSTKYSDERYTSTLSTDEVRAAVADGALLVDARGEEAFTASHIDGSINISVIFTPTDELEALLDQVPANSRVVTICDDFVSCFDAKIVGIKLEYRDHTFLGRYAKSWEY